ncbi:MASE1 domain-containing protein [Stenotrophomonas bentonitica]|uniref:MASE1 domain-containing protein n=1 Tax=Stenotrophomonas bentonitica TaxID=1450134 RepID=UPI00345EDBB0
MSGRTFVSAVMPWARALPEGLFIAALYAAACWAARQVSLDQFFLPAGIRIAALLMLPVRSWPYLLLGDYAYLGLIRLPMLDRYGPEWVFIASAYQLPVAALIVYWSRRLIEARSDTWLLFIAGMAALLIGVGNLSLAHLLWPSPPSVGFLALSARYVLGHYIAIMTVAPLALLWKRRRDIDWPSWSRPPVVYATLLLLACCAGLTLIPQETSAERTTMQLLMAAPVVALTCLQGWWGAAIAMPVMSMVIRINTNVSGLPESFDPHSFNAQLIIAISCSALLSLGSRITHYCRKYSYHSNARKQAIANARSSDATHERRLRMRALNLRKIGDGLDSSLSSTVEWLRIHGHPEMASELLDAAAAHSQRFREETAMIYPTIVEHVGLYLALQAGGVFEALDKTDRLAEPHLAGDPCRLSLDLQLTAYRALTEAVSILLENERGQLKIRARSGWFGPVRGLMVTVGSTDPRHQLSRTTATMATGRLSGRTQVYGGTVHCHRNRIRLCFVESSNC